MEKELAKFFEVGGDPYKSVAEWKEQTRKKVIGIFPMHIPEEAHQYKSFLRLLSCPCF